MDLARARSFLAAHADPVDDLLLWADATPPLGRLSRVWELRRGIEVRALAFSFPLWPASPSLGIKGLTPADERDALAALVQAGVYHNGYVICSDAQQPLWGATGHREAHMTLEAPAWRPVAREVREASRQELDAFYTRYQAGAWHPIQVETGPYVVYEEGGEILAAAGTHFAYPGLAQVGNVLTAPQARGRGLGTLVTAAVVDRLVAAGYPLVSLFVDTLNPARRIYERLGFATRRELHAFPWQAAGQAL